MHHATASVDSHRRDVLQDQGALAEDYNAAVAIDKVNSHHGGNPAVWDTVGAQTDNRAKLGTPPDKPRIGPWHFDKEGVPVVGPKAETGESTGSTKRAGKTVDQDAVSRPADGKEAATKP
jgi:hypothetical protein